MKQYLDLVEQVLEQGVKRTDRTGTGTISLFGTQTRYDLQEGFPLLTTKKVNFKEVVAELLWMLYGFQWRHWGSHPSGIDQIATAIDTIKTTPDSRRIIVSAWNPKDVPDMALPPCHLLFQFYVRDEFLDCQLYQRSADLALGVPFNIASYALLTTMVARECGLFPGVFVHTIGDAHVYLNHVDGLKEQLTRIPRRLPRIVIASEVPFDDIAPMNIKLIGYEHWPAIKFEVSV